MPAIAVYQPASPAMTLRYRRQASSHTDRIPAVRSDPRGKHRLMRPALLCRQHEHAMPTALEVQPGKVHLRVQRLDVNLAVAHFDNQQALLGQVIRRFGQHPSNQVQTVIPAGQAQFRFVLVFIRHVGEVFGIDIRRALAVDIFEANARTHEAHHLLNQPLMSRFLLPTLQAWVDEQPNAQVPLRWLGLQRNEHELLLRALALNPADTPVRMRLIDHHLSSADHATHHLDESHFIGEVQYALDELARAQALITGATEPERLQHLHTELLAYQDLIADWIAYSKAPSGSFPQWCADQGRTYTYPAKYYYR